MLHTSPASVAAVLLFIGYWRSCIGTRSPTVTKFLKLRGGAGYEFNPNYVLPPPAKQLPVRPVTLGDLDGQVFLGQQQPELSTGDFQSHGVRNQLGKQSSLWQTVSDYVKRIHQISPTLSIVSVASIATFVLWQMPVCRASLGRHFLCNRNNVTSRPLSLLLSAISHSSIMHLLMNLMAYVSFGPPLRKTLKATNWPLWPLVVGAALSGSVFFLMQGQGSCLGLSGVTLAFLALQAKLVPDQQLGTVLGVFLVRVPAHVTLKLLLIVSALGSLDRNSSVAHSAHLGGLLYGIAYYEVWLRRNRLRKFSRQVMSMLPSHRKW